MLKARLSNTAQRSMTRVAPRPTTTAPTSSSIFMGCYLDVDCSCPTFRHERRLEASEACRKTSARWRGQLSYTHISTERSVQPSILMHVLPLALNKHSLQIVTGIATRVVRRAVPDFQVHNIFGSLIDEVMSVS